MKTPISFFLTIVLVWNLQAGSTRSRADSLFQVFPLKSHLHYTYDYLSTSSRHELTAITGLSIDSGTVEYVVHDSTILDGSTIRWNIEVRRYILHIDSISYGLNDSTHWIVDTTSCVLTETTTGLHPLAIASLIWQAPLITPLDTTPIFRFSRVESDSISKEWFTNSGCLWGHDTLTFRDHMGLVFNASSSVDGLCHNVRTIVSTRTSLRTSPVVSITGPKNTPRRFALAQNYPNPFNPSTAINYELPANGFVSLKVYDLLGREVATLVNEEKSAGIYQVTFDASNLPSGIYFARLQAGSYSATRKLSLVR